MKKLAVLLPTYNVAPYIAESIDSILNQTFKDFDLYIYDDCSTDNTSEIVSSYKDQRIYYKKNKINLGLSKTLNIGLSHLLSNYEFIARMDADDWAFPERFQKQIEHMKHNKDIVVCGTQGFWLKDISQNPFSGWTYPTSNDYIKLYLLFSASFSHSSLFFRSDFFLKNNFRYDETIKTCEDWDLWTRIQDSGKFANLSDFLMKHRVLENSNHRSVENKMKHLNERSVIISKYWKIFNIDLSPEQVFEYYYQKDFIDKEKFIPKLKILINAFNDIFINHTTFLNQSDKKKFSYLLSRKILDYWKRSNLNRYNIPIWIVLLTNVKFISHIVLIKNLIK